MRILLDTHIFLWSISDNPLLSKSAKDIINQAEDVYISSASIWEISIKSKIGKLDADINLITKAIKDSGFQALPITIEHAAFVSELPEIHKDPFDRILLAQAINEPLKFITADKQLKNYSDLVILI